MRRILVASAAAAACVAAYHPASAQIPVTDGGLISQQTWSNIKTAASWVQQAEGMVSQLEQLKAQYAAIAHLPAEAVSTATSLAQVPSLQNPFPQSGTLQGLLNGSSPPLSSATSFFNSNRVYTPSGTDFGSQELAARATSNANLQGMAAQAMQSVETRISSLREFIGSIGSSPDVQESSAITARLGLEQNYVTSQQVQATQLANLIAVQNRVDQTRAAEASRQSADEWNAHASAAAGIPE